MMLECRQVSYAYEPGWNVVSGVDLALTAGDFAMLLGPNGCGKSTLLKLLAGLLSPQTGQVLAGSRPVNRLPHRERARMIAVVSQSHAPALDFTVRDMVIWAARPPVAMSPPTPEDHRLVNEAIGMLDWSNCPSGLAIGFPAAKRRSLRRRRCSSRAQVMLWMSRPRRLTPRHQRDDSCRTRNDRLFDGLP